MVLDGASDAFVWFLVCNLDSLEAFAPKPPRPMPDWVYVETALQMLRKNKDDLTEHATNAATALSALQH